MSRFGLVTGGGDCPGLNAVIRAVVKRGIALGHEIIGIEGAFRGLLEENGARPMTLERVSGILPRGGTILGTSNHSNPFRYPTNESGKVVESDISDLVLRRLSELDLEGLISVGGDGSLDIARRLMDKGLKVIGVPKTIDNDLSATDQTFGFATARATVTDAIDKLHSTAESHDRVMVLEVMGRNAGFLALDSGIAGGADIILIPEIPYRIDSVIDAVRARQENGKPFSVAVVAEGAFPLGGTPAIVESAESRPGSGVVRLGGSGRALAEALASHIDLEVRVTVLGHLQRGGGPSAFDRLLGSQFGARAVDLASAGKWGVITVLHGNDVTEVPLNAETVAPRQVDLKGQRVALARELGICLGD